MSSAPRKKKTFLLVFGGLGLLLACAAVGFYFYTIWAANKELQEAITEADRLDPGWRLEELEAHRSTLPDEQNAAAQILAITSMMPGGWPPIPPLQEQDKPWWFESILIELSPELQLNEEQNQRLRIELQKISPALTAARKLADIPQGRYTVSWALDPSSTILPCQKARDVATLLELDAFLRAQNKDLDGALESIRGVLNTARSVGEEPSDISQLVRMACQGITITSLERILAQGQASQDRLRNMQQNLKDDISDPLFLYGARGERAGYHRMIDAIESGKLKVSSVVGASTGTPLPGGVKGWWEDFSGEVQFRKSHAPLIRAMSEVVEVAKLPVEQQRPKLKSLVRSIDTNMELPVLVRLMVPLAETVGERFWRQQAYLRCAVVALGAERYRLARNRWPDSLDQLVPEFLQEVPADPYDGKSLRYRRLADGVVIYSIGPDEKDDGGKLDRQNPTAPGTDLGFQLWDVNRRRQPWRPPPKQKDEDD